MGVRKRFRVADVGDPGTPVWLVEVNRFEASGTEALLTQRRRVLADALKVPLEAIVLYEPETQLLLGRWDYLRVMVAASSPATARWEYRDLEIPE